MHKIFHDFETRSMLDLKTSNAWEYGLHNTTRANCMAWAVDDEPVQLWSFGDPFPEELLHHINAGCEMHAWNVGFEKSIWNGCMVPRYGWPQVSDSQWFCTMARAAYGNHPQSLAAAADMLLPGVGKDTAGGKLMLTTCKPQKWTKKELAAGATGLKWIDDPITLALVGAYCKQDVEVERQLHHVLPKWPESEIAVWRMNERINERGIPLDRKLCVAANDIMQQSLVETTKAISKLTNDEITTGNQLQRMKKFLSERNIMDIDDSLDADSVEMLLETPNLPDDCRDVLQMRQITAGSAAKKFKAAVENISSDDRARQLFRYYGGMTGRFAAKKLQPQNMKRGTDKTEMFRDVVCTGDLDLMHTLYGDAIMTELGKNVRSIIRAPEDHMIVRCDSSQIECRVLHWLAGNERMLGLFRDNQDPYLDLAMQAFKRPLTKKDDHERQVGKVAVLGLGFGMGAGRFKAQVWAQTYPKIELTAKFSKYIVDLFREENPQIPKFWYNLQSAAKTTVTRGTTTRVGKLRFGLWQDYLVMRLPSGRNLFYYQPAFEGKGRDERFRYTSVRGVRHEWAGGLLCENAVQAVARDTLVHYMQLAEKAGLHIFGHVHDEIMCLARTEEAAWAERTLLKCFDTPLPWMQGLPCAAEAKVYYKYVG